MKKIKRYWKLEINAEFGSEFQAQYAKDMLWGFLKAYARFILNCHKKNMLTTKIEETTTGDLMVICHPETCPMKGKK